MATQDTGGPSERAAVDRTPSVAHGGSIGRVIVVTLALVGAVTGLYFVDKNVFPQYFTLFLAVLATVGLFSLFALVAGILRFPGKSSGNPLAKAIMDGAADGLLVTDRSGHVIYANGAYLDLTDALDANDVRPVERVFIGDPEVSESVYRLLKAAREGRKL